MNRKPTWSDFAHRCHFRWDIYNPFRTWQKLEAKFYQESPTLTRWKVSLEPVDRGTNYWNFLFSLEYDQEFERREEIMAEHVSVFVSRGVDSITTREEVFYKFCNDNRFQYQVQGTVEMPLQTEPHLLIIRMEVALPRGSISKHDFGSQSEERFVCLSKNMKDLLISKKYHNMCVLSADTQQFYHAHSYVMEVRWNNFFTKHSREKIMGEAININISNELLSDILTYMYSGELRRNWPGWKNSSYAAELCQVIFRYDLHHLYKTIVKSDMKQERLTRNTCHHESHLFPLEIVGGRPLKNASLSWIANPNSYYKILFGIRVGGEYGNWLSYSLKSRSRFRVSVEVNFQIVKKMEGNPDDALFHVHGATYDINPRETKDSGPKIFLGCPETFGDSDEAGIKYYIRCFLNVFDGTKVDTIYCLGEETLQDDSERFRLLSLHMFDLYRREIDTDMVVNSRRSHYWPRCKQKIHKGIFVTRVPEWWVGLENFNKEEFVEMRLANVPCEAKCILSGGPLMVFIRFLYTGYIPLSNISLEQHDIEEIQIFADLTMFSSLNDFIGRRIIS